MANPYCSCKLTDARRAESDLGCRPGIPPNHGCSGVTQCRCRRRRRRLVPANSAELSRLTTGFGLPESIEA